MARSVAFMSDYAEFSSADNAVYDEAISVNPNFRPLTKSPKDVGYHIGTGLLGVGGAGGTVWLGSRALRKFKGGRPVSAAIRAGLAGTLGLTSGHHVARRLGRKGAFDWSPDYNTHANWRKEHAQQEFERQYDMREHLR